MTDEPKSPPESASTGPLANRRPNPFAAPHCTPDERGIYGDARRTRSGFLFRVIEFGSGPIGRLIYDGWWFRQKVEIDGVCVWRIISWLTIRRQIECVLPARASQRSAKLRIEIDFGRSLLIRRFRVWIDEVLLYEEIN